MGEKSRSKWSNCAIGDPGGGEKDLVWQTAIKAT